MFSARKIKDLLKQYNLAPRKGLGQNFLVDDKVLAEIVAAADIKLNDLILEIGPGLGILTLELAKKARKVIAVEKDEKIAEALKDILKEENISNVEIITADVLDFLKSRVARQQAELILSQKYKAVANIPYYLTAPLIRQFLESENPPESMVLMVQKEVAQRITAKPPKMSLLAVSVQFYAKPEIVSFVSKKSFWPEPKVDSAIIRLNVESCKLNVDKELFFKIVKAGFSQPRKQILNNFSKKIDLRKEKIINWLAKNNIKPESRAETLTIADWVSLTETFPHPNP